VALVVRAAGRGCRAREIFLRISSWGHGTVGRQQQAGGHIGIRSRWKTGGSWADSGERSRGEICSQFFSVGTGWGRQYQGNEVTGVGRRVLLEVSERGGDPPKEQSRPPPPGGLAGWWSHGRGGAGRQGDKRVGVLPTKGSTWRGWVVAGPQVGPDGVPKGAAQVNGWQG